MSTRFAGYPLGSFERSGRHLVQPAFAAACAAWRQPPAETVERCGVRPDRSRGQQQLLKRCKFGSRPRWCLRDQRLVGFAPAQAQYTRAGNSSIGYRGGYPQRLEQRWDWRGSHHRSSTDGGITAPTRDCHRLRQHRLSAMARLVCLTSTGDFSLTEARTSLHADPSLYTVPLVDG